MTADIRTAAEAAPVFRFTNAQWREYQQIPDQGYSHRHWIEYQVNEWLRGGAISEAEPGTDLPGVDDGRSLLGEPPYMNVSAARPEWRFPDVTAIMLAGFAGAISAEPQEFAGARIELLDDGCTLRLTPMEGGAQ